ncbi:MAG: ABC transporter permease [Puia sp.]|nr:ABC transporter permease [Puia sp.]
MLRGYFKIAFRNLAKHKFISFINLFGLTVGLTCCLLILTYILHELSYDKYNTKADRIYRVSRSFLNGNGEVSLHLGAVAPPFGPLLQHEFPDIQQAVRLLSTGHIPLRYEDKIFSETNTFFAEQNVFDVFDIGLLQGNPKKALADPFSVLLTEEVAKRYFGNADPIDKIIRMNDQFNFKVTGIFKELPENSHWHPKILMSFNTLKDTALVGEKNLTTNFSSNNYFTYLLLPKGYPARNIEARFPAFLDKVMGSPGQKPGTGPSTWTHLYLQKLTDIHLRSHLDSEIEDNGDIKRVYIFSAIALFILLIACINYMNLSTARSALRAREIGIRKVSGARKGELITQFLSESVLTASIAIVMAVILARFALPLLNTFTGQTLSAEVLFTWRIGLPILLTPLVVGTLSGLYPALFMSSFQPVKTLKGLFKADGSSISFRKVLVVAQFSISIILLISTAIVFGQLRYMQQKSLGFDKEQILTMNYADQLDPAYKAFRTELMQNSYIKNMARSSRIPTGRLLDNQGASSEAGDSMRPVNADIKYLAVDYDFVPTYGISIAAGRNFSRDFASDTAGFVLNETAVTAIGWKNPREAIGKTMKYGDTKGNIIGVIKDFHFESMHQKIVPLIMVLPPASWTGNSFGDLSIKITGNNLPAALAHIEKTWKRFLPGIPYRASFLDERFDGLYRSEQRQGSLFTVFSGIAILIACLGLFGLSAFAIIQRTKEIGIRKVLGASVTGIIGLLSKDFLLLVGIAALIAFPVAGYAMHSWLQDFAYRVQLSWWIFLAAGFIAAAVALLTIGLQAFKAATANPVSALRSE